MNTPLQGPDKQLEVTDTRIMDEGKVVEVFQVISDIAEGELENGHELLTILLNDAVDQVNRETEQADCEGGPLDALMVERVFNMLIEHDLGVSEEAVRGCVRAVNEEMILERNTSGEEQALTSLDTPAPEVAPKTAYLSTEVGGASALSVLEQTVSIRNRAIRAQVNELLSLREAEQVADVCQGNPSRLKVVLARLERGQDFRAVIHRFQVLDVLNAEDSELKIDDAMALEAAFSDVDFSEDPQGTAEHILETWTASGYRGKLYAFVRKILEIKKKNPEISYLETAVGFYKETKSLTAMAKARDARRENGYDDEL